MMTQTRRIPRRDPLLLFRLQSDFAAGLAPAQIAEKHDLTLFAVAQALRRGGDGRLADPYLLTHRDRAREDATLLYWIGYIASCGAVFDGPNPTLVLDVDAGDLPHVQTLIEDLCDGRPVSEACQSSLRGLQVYIRDRDLGRLLVHWGIPGANRAAGSVPVGFIPPSLLSHFMRGYIEGGRTTPPYGAGRVPGSLRTVRRVVIAGPQEFILALRDALTPALGGLGSITGRGTGPAKLTYSGHEATRLLRFVYRGATRSLPRAASLQQELSLNHRAGQHRSSKD